MAPSLLGPPQPTAMDTATATTTITNESRLSTIITTTISSYISSGNPCLDFFHVAPETPPEELIERLQFSYQNNPLKTLKLICNLRGVRGTGKNDKEGFYASALWLHKNHPKTLANNVGRVALFGSLKDLLEILFRILEGIDVRKRMKHEWETEKRAFFAKRWGSTSKLSELDDQERKAAKAEKKAAKAKKAVDRYTNDPEYKFLFDCICDVFADYLRNDVILLGHGDTSKISLAAKWCPSLDSSYDESLLICETIAKKVFPKEEYVEYQGIEEAHYAYRVRTRLRKAVLVPLRKALEVPEVFMCAKRWRDIPYEKVPSMAMHLGKKVFLKRDVNGFQEYLDEVRNGESTIAAGALLPHDLISRVTDGNLKLDKVLELQWKRMVDDLANQGTLINCVAVSDNSFFDVCVGLVLLVSELTLEPWKGKTVSTYGGVVEIEGEKLYSKVESVKGMFSTCEIDLQEVFDSILKFAVENNLSEEQMVRRVFLFTVMEAVQFGEEEYGDIQRKFADNGYQKVPEIVCWNVGMGTGMGTGMGMGVKCDQPGVASVTGCSKNLLTLLFQELEEFSPEGVMDSAISRPEYDLLVVHD